MFSQILKLIPRLEFESLVSETGSERASKGLSSWSQFVAMMFCQLGRANSLREIEGGLRSCEGKLVHLGIEAPKRSSLSYANKHRPWQLYERLFYRVLERVSGKHESRHKFRFSNKLVSLDSTLIDLCLSVFDWAQFNRTKGAMKLHMVLDHDGYMPCFGLITDANVHDVTVAQRLQFAAGTVVVEDRGYTDYGLYAQWTAQGVYFVTRLRKNAQFEIVKRHSTPANPMILADQTIQLTGKQGRERCPYVLRRIEVVREDTGETLVFLTNHHRLSASTVAAVYKERWQIELLFKALKQNLRLKTFVGTSANAVKTQIWCALISMLLVRYLQLRSRRGWSLSNLVALLRMNLFTHRDLNAWIDQPFQIPPETSITPRQTVMAF